MAESNTTPSWADWTDAELEELRVAVMGEQARRRRMANAVDLAEQVSRQVAEAEELVDGAPWVQRDFIGYPRGWHVTHIGKRWRSLWPNNMDEPGVAGWREAPADGSPGEYVKPERARDGYRVGEAVMFDGSRFVATRSGVRESPAENPSAWRLDAPVGPSVPSRPGPAAAGETRPDTG